MKLNLEIKIGNEVGDLADQITKWNLKEMKEVIEELCQPSYIDTWDAINVVLAYMCTTKELLDMENDTDPKWIKMVSEQ